MGKFEEIPLTSITESLFVDTEGQHQLAGVVFFDPTENAIEMIKSQAHNFLYQLTAASCSTPCRQIPYLLSRLASRASFYKMDE